MYFVCSLLLSFFSFWKSFQLSFIIFCSPWSLLNTIIFHENIAQNFRQLFAHRPQRKIFLANTWKVLLRNISRTLSSTYSYTYSVHTLFPDFVMEIHVPIWLLSSLGSRWKLTSGIKLYFAVIIFEQKLLVKMQTLIIYVVNTMLIHLISYSFNRVCKTLERFVNRFYHY